MAGVVGGVPGCVHGAEGGAFDGEELAVVDVELGRVGSVVVDTQGEARVVLDQV